MTGTTRLLLAAALVAALVAGAAWTLTRTSGSDGGPTAPLDTRGEVWLIPGRGGNLNALDTLVARLQRDGTRVVVIPIDTGTGPVSVYRDDITRRLATVSGPVDLVGYSAGGIIARAVADTDGSKIRRIATIASPHAGTGLAALGRIDGCDRMCEDLAPDSDLLNSLDHRVDAQRWLTIWSTSDQVITPPDSAALAGATSVNYQQLCGRDIDHGTISNDPHVADWIARWLADGTPPSAC